MPEVLISYAPMLPEWILAIGAMALAAERFDADGRTGVSDHWPMIATIELTQKQ